MTDKKRPPYTSGADLASLFERMRSLQDPGAIDSKWVESMGLASSQPTGVVAVLKWLGVIDKQGKSQGVWNKLRVEATREETLSDLVLSAYSDVFDRIDISQASRSDLEGAFIVAYDAGDPGRLIKCFLALCGYAGITVNSQLTSRTSGSPGGAQRAGKEPNGEKATATPPRRQTPKPNPPSPKPATPAKGDGGAPRVVLNVEIPAEWSEEEVLKRIEAVQRAVAS